MKTDIGLLPILVLVIVLSQSSFARLYPEAELIKEDVGSNFQNFNHSGTIAETRSGDLVVAWYAGTSEGSGSTRIYVSRKVSGSNSWTDGTPVDVGGEDGSSCWNPVLFQPKKTGAPLILYYKYSGDPTSWKGVVRTSTDNGQTWSSRTQLPNCVDGIPYCGVECIVMADVHI